MRRFFSTGFVLNRCAASSDRWVLKLAMPVTVRLTLYAAADTIQTAQRFLTMTSLKKGKKRLQVLTRCLLLHLEVQLTSISSSQGQEAKGGPA